MPRLTRRQRRQLDTEAGRAVRVHPALSADAAVAAARHPSNQAPAPRPGTSPPAGLGRGLVVRAKGYLARRYIDKLGPAIVPPLVAGAVILVTLGVVVGVVLGVVLAQLARPVDDL